ncbi:hypothetical protein [Lysinibacillus sp. NPDC056185]|uniref:hypothetical protein n=1 Tax=Lysinibacillus sp. NPDC056185 TaxID=3345739 RepID=UPI0039EE0305
MRHHRTAPRTAPRTETWTRDARTTAGDLFTTGGLATAAILTGARWLWITTALWACLLLAQGRLAARARRRDKTGPS